MSANNQKQFIFDFQTCCFSFYNLKTVLTLPWSILCEKIETLNFACNNMTVQTNCAWYMLAYWKKSGFIFNGYIIFFLHNNTWITHLWLNLRGCSQELPMIIQSHSSPRHCTTTLTKWNLLILNLLLIKVA